MKMPAQDGSAKVDLYIAEAAAFAQPILTHVRSLIHQAVPGVEETIKWSRPFFLHRGAILCQMAAFTKHCGFGFWSPDMAAVARADGFDPSEASGFFGRLTTVQDLPPDRTLIAYLRQAITLAEQGSAQPRPSARLRVQKPAIEPPEEFLDEIRAKGAADAFDRLAPGCRREYLTWILEAKRTETRARRIADSVARIAEGRSLHASSR